MILSSSPSLAHACTHNNAFCCVFANSYKKNSKRRSSCHVESDSTWGELPNIDQVAQRGWGLMIK
jgi:hypothetical protein